MIRSVLSRLLIFQLSFYKAPGKTCKVVEQIQNNSLWGSSAKKRRVNWFQWQSLYLPIDKGGLVFKSFKEFNYALLFKWHGKMLQGTNSLRHGVLSARYGSLNHQILSGCNMDNQKSKSAWWSDILSLESEFVAPVFSDNCRAVLSDGSNVAFWSCCWSDTGKL